MIRKKRKQTRMNNITEPKLVYNEFKYFKNIYTTLNRSNYIIFSKKENNVSLDFLNDPADVFYILRGETSSKTLFFNWIREFNIICKVSLSTLKTIKETLKKEVVSVSWNEESFTFKTVNEGITIFNEPSLEGLLEKPKDISNILPEKEVITEDFFKDDITEIFEGSNGEISLERTEIKILEIPSKKILSTLKNGKPFIKRINQGTRRLVAIEFEDEELELSLIQIFATI